MAKDKPEENATSSPAFVVTVTSSSHRRRAGLAFGPSPVHLTREQLEAKLEGKLTVAEALQADPLLVIRPYRDPTDKE